MHQPTPDQRIPADQIHTLTPRDLLYAAAELDVSEDHQRAAVIWGITAAQVAAGLGTFNDLHPEIAAEFCANTLDPETGDIDMCAVAAAACYNETFPPAVPVTAIPANDIGTITPSQVLADARAAGARPDHALDAVAVAIASVMEPVTGIDFHHLLPSYANDVQSWAHGWLHLHHGCDPRVAPIDYAVLDDDVVAGMLDHIAEQARRYDPFAD
ncbi:hypothetical protein FAF44_02570 [Nonomuraea sp. MG754425]|uniref:hypothetical protein n=1 Tax=Nonomuraea sp. MG754425 TaxID=2570319 RepID=UPI001F215D3E|nr:hypothetical protein [Nonomuraea sp. MG754425]MCF6467297.1 hypothetical protein [Nonomuraea sp. MG754425]